MKIGVIDNLPDGGTKRVVMEQVKGLVKHHEVYYVGPESKLFDPGIFATEVLRVNMEWHITRGVVRPFFDILLWYRLFRSYSHASDWFSTHQVDLVLAHPDRYTQCPMITRTNRLPTYYFMEEWPRIVYEKELHPIETQSTLKRFYEHIRRYLLKQIDKFLVYGATQLIVGSWYVSTQARSAYGVQPYFAKFGTDTEYFKPADVTTRHFLFVGSRAHIDGSDLLLALQSRLPKLRIKWVNLHEKSLSDDELLEAYQQAVALICLSYNEPFGMSALEAMACGIPVIAVREGGYRETVVDQETGLHIERSEEALLTSIKHLAGDNQLRNAMGHSARNWILSQYTLSRHICSLEEILGKAA